jgi:hypothetical protein
VIIQSRPPQILVAEVEAEGFDQMQLGASIGAHADDIARIGRDFRLVENDGEHVGLI